jgi:hypothetical protein
LMRKGNGGEIPLPVGEGWGDRIWRCDPTSPARGEVK